jgi:muramoyltetrapeptide carboxypeptidase
MNRRDLFKGLAATTLLSGSAMAQAKRNSKVKLIKPKRLKAGDTVAVIAPSSSATPEAWERAIANLESLGLKPKVAKSARGVNGFLSAPDKDRLADLHEAFADQTVNGIWCVRGGYGAGRLLPSVDFNLIKKNPKVFIGYSDITAFHLSIPKATGLVTFHGPVGTSALSDYTKKYVVDALFNASPTTSISLSDFNRARTESTYKTETVTAGKARGRLVGGNLSLLAALAGTPYALPDLKGKIVFIEDIGEAPYRIDRMLTQIRQSSNIHEAAGLALGVFEDCEAKDKNTQQLIDVVRDRLGDLKIPCVYGLSFGHIRDQFTLPVGIEAELDASNQTVTLLESSVV